ncbi:GNAT family N-acetyltransferase [Micromonospora maritima]|uniref:GNAT family N-acetyltransferase n=1 Tax=Micromonospora maritima TaxID=986711 RepID=UPI00157BFF1B|nr:GNAT family N-acetyltransferase [Micromonospora maritima]
MSDVARILPLRGIRRATSADLRDVTELLAHAFLHAGPVAPWLVPDPDERLEVYLGYFGLFAVDAFDRGTIEINHEITCAALWYPPDQALGHPENYEEQLADITGERLERFQVLDRLLAAAHPRGRHEYLAFLAVAPEVQGMGQGSRMLRHHHTTIDDLDLPAYLEASNVDNRRLYARHGYSTTGRVQLPDGGPTLFPMWRPKVSAPPPAEDAGE